MIRNIKDHATRIISQLIALSALIKLSFELMIVEDIKLVGLGNGFENI